jgi:hypothetical protein
MNYGWQLQGHLDGSFKFCDKDFAMPGFRINSLGARYDSVCLAIVNSETAEGYDWTYRAVVNALYLKYRLEHEKGYFHILCNNMKDVAIKHFP